VLQIVTVENSKYWDEVVKSFKKHDVNYLSGYVKAFQLQGDGEPLLFYYNDNTTRAINVVMKRDIALVKPFKKKLPLNTYFDISTPYGYGGFLIEGDNYNAVNDAYDTYCKENGYVSEFIRFHLFSGFQPYYTGVSETQTRNVVRDLEIPLNDMVMNFEHKVRKSLKKAEKAGLEIEIDTSGARLEEFLDIYYGTLDRSKAKENFYFPEDFFYSINEMEGNYIYMHVLYENKVISTELVIYGIENCYSFLGGTNRDYFHLCANNFLKYEIIKWAKEKGLKRFILGGGYGANDGIYKYKKSYAPNGIHDFYIGKKIFDENRYKELVEIRSEEADFDGNTFFFPAYRG
jgi:hypothetical protein